MPQQIPASLDAEQALLGLMLSYTETVSRAYEESLDSSDFLSDANKRVYRAIQKLYSERKPVDITSVITKLSDTDQLDKVGGADYIMKLSELAVSSVNSDYYIKTIMEKALLRKLIDVSEEIKNRCFEGQENPYDVLNDAESLISKVSRERKTTDFIPSEVAMEQAINQIQHLSKTRGMTGVTSGFTYLDHMTNGFQKSDLIILAARPSVGKTAFALNIAVNAATRANNSVAVFALEMPAIQLANRMLSAKSLVDSNKLRTGQNIDNSDWAKIDQARNELAAARIFIDDSSTIKVNDIYAKCRKLQSEHGLDLVIIDYLQLISGSSSNKNGSREQEVSEISRALKQMARELNIPVIALSQLSRKVEDAGREPGLADLRESGAIEQDADIVMFLHREKQQKKEDGEEEEAPKQFRDIKLIIAKHRNGSIGDLELAFEGKYNIFRNKERVHDENE